MSARTVLITGATGKQGGAVINALLARPQTPPLKIYALTRNLESAAAKELAKKPNVSLVKGDLDNCPGIFKSVPEKIWGVFSVQAAIGNGASPELEEVQGKNLVNAAVANDVQFFVYSSVDRGGPEASDTQSTNVPHFASKYRVEKVLIEKAATTNMQWTILRPTVFFDNLTPDFMGKAIAATWKTMSSQTKLHHISCKDIGIFAAIAFNNPEEYKGRCISLAGDYLTLDEAKSTFKSVVGSDMPTTFTLMGKMLRWGVKEMGTMYSWFENTGFQADIPELKKLNPELQDFRSWLQESSKFAKK